MCGMQYLDLQEVFWGRTQPNSWGCTFPYVLVVINLCSSFSFTCSLLMDVPSVLWRCWLGSTRGIRPVKTAWWGTSVVICLERGQMICIRSSWWHCLPIISCSSKIQNGLPLWCWLTQVVLGKRPSNGHSRSSVVLMDVACSTVPGSQIYTFYSSLAWINFREIMKLRYMSPSNLIVHKWKK